MMEYWNDGILGFGKMAYWVIGKIPLDTEPGSLYIFSFLLKPIPLKTGSSTFHYSIIPLFHARGKSSRLEKYFDFTKLQEFRDV